MRRETETYPVEEIKPLNEHTYPSFSYGLVCPFLSRREGFSNDCLRQYCMLWQDNQCLFVALYKRLKGLLAGKGSGGGNA